MFCVECGKETEIFRNGVCINCYLKNKSFSKGPDIFDITICSNCSSYKYKNLWLRESFNKILNRHIKDKFKISDELKKVKIKTECDEKGKTVLCKIIIMGYLDDHEISEEHFLSIRIKNVTCDICSKQFGGYFEATLQIRANKRKLMRKEIDTIRLDVETIVKSYRNKGNRGLFITDIGEEHGGMDFYLSEKGSAYTIAKKIQDKFGGEIKESSKNFGMRDGRQVYRMTYLLRIPQYRKGDFISYNNSYFYISSLSGNKVHTFELSNWIERVFDGKDLQHIKIVGGKDLIKEIILVSQSNEEVQLMDPKTYKTFEIKKPKNFNFKTEVVKIVNIENNIFIIPEKNIIDK
jgi:nonsense-mediated mRNA decay protein 3